MNLQIGLKSFLTKFLIMKTSTNKTYDCVKAVRKERERIAKDTEGMTPKEVLEYFKKRREKQVKTNVRNSKISNS